MLTFLPSGKIDRFVPSLHLKHIFLGVKEDNYSAFFVSAFCVKSIAGVRTTGMSGSADTGTIGRVFIIAVTSAIKVLFKLGRLKRASLREMPSCLALESNTACTWPGFRG